MSITFNHKVGQHGNQLFVCLKAAIIAYEKGLNISLPSNGLVEFRKFSSDLIQNNVSRRKTVGSDVNQDEHVSLNKGYYQRAEHFNPHRETIMNKILKLPKIYKNCKDVVIHIRLDGFNHKGYNSHIIDPKWYVGILKKIQLERLFIVMDTNSGRIWKKQNGSKKRYITHFHEFNPVVVSSDARNDFEFIRSFDNIICSNSTFCFWACFLSDASQIYMPPFWESKRTKLSKIKNATVVSENYGYVNIDTMENVKISFQ